VVRPGGVAGVTPRLGRCPLDCMKLERVLNLRASFVVDVKDTYQL
jgi:hypothetical protein